MKSKIYLGIDWGEKRIGLAIAEEETSLALPLRTVATLTELLQVIKDEGITNLVLGSPKKMSGEQANNPAWLNFIDQLVVRSGINVNLLDERLSSLAADALSGQKKDKAGRDEIAATLILQDYLDKNLN